MSGPDRAAVFQNAPQTRVHNDVASPVGGKPVELDSKPFSPYALGKIDEILKGNGAMKHLPELFSVLQDEQKVRFREHRLGDLVIAPGEMALECARLLGADAGQSVRVALSGQPPASTSQLRAFLIGETGRSLAAITGDAFTRLKATFGGALMDAIPSTVNDLRYLAEHAGFLRWFIETTPPGICAHVMANALSPEMAGTLDREHLWSWVDHLSPVDVTARIVSVIDSVRDTRARDKLAALAGPRAGADSDAYEAAHVADLRESLARKQTIRELMEAIGRAGRVLEADVEPLIAAMQRLHASADDVLAVVTRAPIERGRGLRMLLSAPGVTAHHLVTMLNETAISLELLGPIAR